MGVLFRYKSLTIFSRSPCKHTLWVHITIVQGEAIQFMFFMEKQEYLFTKISLSYSSDIFSLLKIC